MSDDFCVIHGYQYMKKQIGNPIAYCEQCEKEFKMVQIGGKSKKVAKPSQPQFVVQISQSVNEYAKLTVEGVDWVGDPNAATKFDSKYAAKTRVRELVDVPDTRCFKELV